MKKVLLSTLLIVFTAAFIQAQVIIDEDFDSYTSGDKMAQSASAPWTTWSNAPGGAEDGTIMDKYAASGSNSLFIANGNDLVLLLGDSTGGFYELSMKLYTPSDSCTYFNVLHKFDGGSSIWAADFYGLRDSTFRFLLQGNDTAQASYNPNMWHDFKLEINMDNDMARLSMDGNMMFEWPWTMTSGDATMGPNQLGGANFYGYDVYSDGLVGTFIDDLKLEKLSTVSFKQATNEVSLNIYPNPTNKEINIQSSEQMKSVRIYNVAGSEVMNFTPLSDILNVNISDLSNGLYYMSINYGDKVVVRKIVKK
ncbi:MAG: T9SS type A sorting domain-containing protein [Bacteroidales bacterium]|nr:T9SS type A sorting domain-containing protein [Bacteroidales bacterium]